MKNVLFRFREWKEKVDQEQNLDEDTIEFTEKKTFIFNQELSGELTGDEIVTMAHPLILVTRSSIFYTIRM